MIVRMRPRTFYRFWALLIVLAFLVGIAISLAIKAYACDAGSYYDPAHQICGPTPPVYSGPHNYYPGYFPGPSNEPYPPRGGQR